MVGPVLKACKQCSFITEDDTCPRCGGQTSKEWQGYLAVIAFEKSEIAKKMGISANGRDPLKGRLVPCSRGTWSSPRQRGGRSRRPPGGRWTKGNLTTPTLTHVS